MALLFGGLWLGMGIPVLGLVFFAGLLALGWSRGTEAGRYSFFRVWGLIGLLLTLTIIATHGPGSNIVL